MDIDYEIIGKRIKETRLRKNLTQQNIAKKLNISVAFLSRVERGKSKINLERLVEISNLLNIQVSYLIDGSAKKSKIYLKNELNEILDKCTIEQRKFIYNIAKLVIEKTK